MAHEIKPIVRTQRAWHDDSYTCEIAVERDGKDHVVRVWGTVHKAADGNLVVGRMRVECEPGLKLTDAEYGAATENLLDTYHHHNPEE